MYYFNFFSWRADFFLFKYLILVTVDLITNLSSGDNFLPTISEENATQSYVDYNLYALSREIF